MRWTPTTDASFPATTDEEKTTAASSPATRPVHGEDDGFPCTYLPGFLSVDK